MKNELIELCRLHSMAETKHAPYEHSFYAHFTGTCELHVWVKFLFKGPDYENAVSYRVYGYGEEEIPEDYLVEAHALFESSDIESLKSFLHIMHTS